MEKHAQTDGHETGHGARNLAIAAGSVAAARAVIPYLLTRLANAGLSRAPGIRGKVDRVELRVARGSVSVTGLALDKTDAGPAASVRVDRITASIDWKSLMTGALVLDAEVDRPRVTIDMKPRRAGTAPAWAAPPKKAAAEGGDWRKKLHALPSIRLGLSVKRGEVRVAGAPGMEGDVRASEIGLRVENVTNASRPGKPVLARAHGRARLLSGAELRFRAEADPLAGKPAFNADAEVRGLALTDLAGLARSRMGLDVKDGLLDLRVEAASKEGRLEGYVEPRIDGLSVEPVKDAGLGARAEAAGVRAAVGLLRSGPQGRISTRVEFDGALDNPRVDVMRAVGLALKNAFSKTRQDGFEDRIRFRRTEAGVEIAARKEPRSGLRHAVELVKETASRWSRDQAPRMAAALSYYTAFSLAPLLLLATAVAGLAFGREAAQGRIVAQLAGLVGRQSAEVLQSMLQAAHKPAQGALATFIGLAGLLAGASGVLSELKNALNRIWSAEEPGGFKELLRRNLKFLGFIAAVGFLLLVSLVVSAALAALGTFMGGLLPTPTSLMQAVNVLLSWAVVSALFAVMFKVLPNTDVAWRDVRTGAAVTGLLFAIGKHLLGLYLGRGAVGSSYGAAGSVLILLLWVYYSGLIFYFGAEFTRVYSERHGSRRPPEAPGIGKAA